MCKGICKKFRVKKPADAGRYESGQALCQICEMWMDHRGMHTNDGNPATEKSIGWFCNCCNFRVRKRPRSKKGKEALRARVESTGMKTSVIKSRIPKQSEITLPILQICSDGKSHSTHELASEIANRFGLGDEARNLIQRRNETVLENRIRWSMFELRKAGLVTSNRGPITITNMGQNILKKNPERLDREFLIKNSSYKISFKKKDNNTSNGIDRVNKMIITALHMIKTESEGIYLSDLKRTLKISDVDKVKLLPKLARIEGISKKEIRHKGELLDILLKYELHHLDPTQYSDAKTGDFTHKTLDTMTREIKNALVDEPTMTNLFDILDSEIDKCDKNTLRDIIDKLK